jgi:DNA topoisomerase-1
MVTETALPEVSIQQLKRLRKDPKRTAALVGLNYINCNEGLGYFRKKRGKNIYYVDEKGNTCKDPRAIQRIKSLVLPPAWTNVWISSDPNGHLQATGLDVAGRKQYRYHEHWNQIRNRTKYFRLLSFSEELPQLRDRMDGDLRKVHPDLSKTIALVLKLMERTAIRVGNERYRLKNGSFGITTLNSKHVEVKGKTIRFRFVGKKGVKHDIVLKDERLSRHIRNYQEMKGRRLFKYLHESGSMRPITASHINQYIQENTCGNFSTKDFRTWMGTISAFDILSTQPPATSPTDLKRKMNACLDKVAAHLGNTRTVCRKYYVHPAVFRAYESNKLQQFIEKAKSMDDPLSLTELAVKALLGSRFHALSSS